MISNKKKTITLQEFKAWLEGVEEMQGTGWSPDVAQWKRIRQKINLIVEASVPPLQQQVSHFDRGNLQQLPTENINIPRVPSSFERAGINNNTTLPSTPVSRQKTKPHAAEAVRTPDIDTSKSGYTSSFE